MTTHRMYIELPDTTALIDWLASKPDGTIHILVGNCDRVQIFVAHLISELTSDGMLATWLAKKLQSGEMIIKAMGPTAPDLEKDIVVSQD